MVLYDIVLYGIVWYGNVGAIRKGYYALKSIMCCAASRA